MSYYDRHGAWFLAQLKPNSAAIAERNLHRQGFRTFLPLEPETRKRGGKFVDVTRPLFPGYLFVAFDPARGHWRSINSTQGVARLVSFGNAPAPVPSELVSGLIRRCDDDGKLLPTDARSLVPGDRVRLQTGPFADFVAEVESLASDQRIWVLIDLMGNRTRMQLGAGQVCPI
ncbi:transcription termination/antitermination protein NusG [Rhodobacter maris]|uniref:Transcriptional antiterminator RfaH n=1 Tax=Rhodobacter maris TaxID=446682 RepID=A0A285TGU3_9RHOB|nr:transcriptional activator RfaH [Rhodobacter maris]SOC21262.1 transcriptional antiterminator RfaH [Rhodobacter maris]